MYLGGEWAASFKIDSRMKATFGGNTSFEIETGKKTGEFLREIFK